MTRGWDHTPCPGGVRVAGHGTSLAEAFAEAALGVFALVVPPAAIEERERREVRAHGVSPEAFLGAWIGECLYLYDVEGFVARRNFVPLPGTPLYDGQHVDWKKVGFKSFENHFTKNSSKDVLREYINRAYEIAHRKLKNFIEASQ